MPGEGLRDRASAPDGGASTRLRGFAPVAARGARVLVLGSMPGAASLRAAQYYAHPRNAFWRIAGDLLGFAPEAPYDERLAGLLRARIALWDVLQSCRRAGSLDAKIDPASAVPNDFAAFFTAHTSLRRVCFNGAAAERLFRRHVQPRLAPECLDRIEILRLPSTSPAHAMITMYAAVANRTSEIGTLRALGFQRMSILTSFLLESHFLGFSGGVAGLFFASFLQLYTVSTMNWQTFSELAFTFSLTIGIMYKALLFALIMGFIGGVFPAFRASRMNIVEALWKS